LNGGSGESRAGGVSWAFFFASPAGEAKAKKSPPHPALKPFNRYNPFRGSKNGVHFKFTFDDRIALETNSYYL
jgi:hypothetical protein